MKTRYSLFRIYLFIIFLQLMIACKNTIFRQKSVPLLLRIQQRNILNEMTFVSVPRSLSNSEERQRIKIALASWLAVSPSTKILLFVNQTEFDPNNSLRNELEMRFPPEDRNEMNISHQKKENRIIYGKPIRTNYGIPLVNDWFIQGVKQCPTKYVTFINGDIIIAENWLKTVEQIYSTLDNEKIVIIDQRINVDIPYRRLKKLNKKLTAEKTNFFDALNNTLKKCNSVVESPDGIDIYTFRADEPPFDVHKIHPFLMGVPCWDNWIVGLLHSLHLDTVTLNLNPPIYHINHYKEKKNFSKSDPRYENNFKPFEKDGYFGSNYNTMWKIEGCKLINRNQNNISYKLYWN